MRDISLLQYSITEWADKVYPNRTVQNAVTKLLEEIGEWAASPRDPDELADMCIVIFDIASMLKVDIGQEIVKKMEINKARSWRITDKGTMQHVEK